MKILFFSAFNHDYLNHLLKSFSNLNAKIKKVRFRVLLKNLLFSKEKFVIHLQFLIKYYQFFIILFLSKLKKIPIVWTPHNLTKTQPNGRTYGLLNYFLKRVDKIIVLCKTNKRKLIKNGIADTKIEIIPHAPFEDYKKYAINKHEARRRLGLAKNKLAFLQFGPLRLYKGFHLTLGAYEQLSENFRNKIEIIFAGKILDKDLFERVKHAKINQVLLLNRYLTNEEVGLVFSASDVVLLPYIKVSQSGCLFLALAFNKPVIASRIGGLTEVIKDNQNGFLINPNIEDLKNAMIKFIKNPSLVNQFTKYQSKNKLIGWMEIAQAHQKIYAKLQK